MKEQTIKKRVLRVLSASNWIYWVPSKVKYQQNDIFGIYDIIALKGNKIRFIQFTTVANLSKHRKKMNNFFQENNIKRAPNVSIELWGWSSKKKEFKIEEFVLNSCSSP